MRVHVLKTWPDYYKALADGTKRFELRNDDRDYCVGDYLCLREWDPATEKYGPGWPGLCFRVTYRTPKDCPFLPARLAAMSLAETTYAENVAILKHINERKD